MSATLFKEVSYSLSKLLADIDMGEIGWCKATISTRNRDHFGASDIMR